MTSDGESLEETLAFLDEALRESDAILRDGDQDPLDFHLFATLGGDIDQELSLFTANEAANPQQASDQQPTPKKRKKNYSQNRARKERHAELVKLRGDVEDLEFTLKRLKTIPGERSSQGTASSEKEVGEGAGAVWRDACARQLERRLRAERENMHLMKSVEKDKQFVKSMQNLLGVRPALWNMTHPGTRKCTKRIEIPPDYIKHVADLIFAELSAGVEATYRGVEFMSRAIEPLLMQSMAREPVIRDTWKGKRVEALTGLSCHLIGQCAADDAQNVVTESFGIEIADVEANTCATFYAQQVLRRHNEDERVVFVWNTYIEPLAFKKKRVGGVYYREESYVLIKPDSESGNCTCMSSHEVITPHFLDPRLTKDATTAAVTFSSMPSDIMTRNEMVESLLLDRSLEQRRHADKS